MPMEMTGEHHIPAPRERVWQALNDPETLKRAIPGCREIEKLSDTEFTAKVVAKVGPVSATFGGKINLSDLDPPRAYTISGEGSGGVAGFAKGSAKVNLDEAAEAATVLRYQVQAHVGGKLAQIGSRLIDATSRKMADDFFGRFVAAIEPATQGNGAVAPEAAAPIGSAAMQPTGLAEDVMRPKPAASEPVSDAVAAVPPPVAAAAGDGTASHQPEPDESPEHRSRLSPAVWVTGLTALVAGMLYYFTRRGSR
jgi:uncharacterized protein